MILQIECKIDCETIIDDLIEVRSNAYVFKLYPDDKWKLCRITVECRFPDYQEYIPKVVIENNTITVIEFPKNDFYIDQISMLQYLESFGALDLGVNKIHWDNPTVNWIAENDEERIAVKGYNKRQDYPQNNRKVTSNWLQGTLIHRNMLKHLTEPFSFYRIGFNHYHQHSYIQAFLHFYLMLEGVFGSRNTDKTPTIAAFMDSANLLYAINLVLENFNNHAHAKHKGWFVNYSFQKFNFDEDPVRKLINIFVDERGKLAHYLMANEERRRKNFEENSYQSLAFVSMTVCYFASIKLRFAPFLQKV